MRCLVAPYNQMSDPIPRDGGSCHEIINPSCFAAAIQSGLTPSGKPIALVRGHKRHGRKRREWVICDTRSGLKLIDSPQGLLIDFPGELPPGFSGFSVSLAPHTYRRIGNAAFRLLAAGIRHVALLTELDVPAYPSTFIYVSNYARLPETAESLHKRRREENREKAPGQEAF